MVKLGNLIRGLRPEAGAGLTLVLLVAAPLAAQHPQAPAATNDSAFRGVQNRGAAVMGVDQYTSQHVFAATADGGTITLVRLIDDTTGARQIREHFAEIAQQFGRGEFTAPFLVHDMTVPGTLVMAERRALIRYSVREIPRGGELRIVTADRTALAAIHEFLAFQRADHRAHH